MILIDPELDLGPTRQLRGLSPLPLAGSAGSRPSPVDASPRTKWRRSALPWAERVPTPQTLSRFLAQAQTAIGLRGQVTVLLTSDRALRDLNRRFRGKNKPTDVLSFPSTNPASGPEKMAGDLAISVETARRQAAEQGHALACELKVLILHGLLHLAGHDHETDAGEMRRREQALRARFKLPQGLIERASPQRESRPKTRPTAGGASRRDAGKLAPDAVRRGTRRTQSGGSKPNSQKPRRGAGNASSLAARRLNP